MSGEERAPDAESAAEGDASSQQRQPPGGQFSEQKPVKAGEELDVTITEISRRGDGIARIQGFVVFVPTASQGQHARIRITSIKPNYAVAELMRPSAPD
jgi:predicted RNA-binding protein with TRAM domain